MKMNRQLNASVVLVVPLFNESKRWDRSYWERIILTSSLRIIFVNDGSEDRTLELIQEFSRDSNRIEVIDLDRNQGKSEALRAGMLKVLSETSFSCQWLGYMDGDGAFDTGELKHIIETLKSNPYVLSDIEGGRIVQSLWMSRIGLSGRRIDRRATRHYTSRILLTLIGFFVEGMPYDSQCGLKFFRNTSHLKEALKEKFRTRWFFDLEILIRMRGQFQYLQLIREEPLEYWKDVGGSKIVLKQYPRILVEVISIMFLGLIDRNSRRKQI
jgi:dolichyl-phosphate beta-glucosyltransferase